LTGIIAICSQKTGLDYYECKPFVVSDYFLFLFLQKYNKKLQKKIFSKKKIVSLRPIM